MTAVDQALHRVPTRNLRVARAEFGAVWTTAQRQAEADRQHGVAGWYTAGVIVTCLWLADAPHHPAWGRPHPARSPVGDRDISATEDSIEAEYQAAELMPEHQPWLLEQRPGWCEGIRATLRWAWRHDGPPPLDENGEPIAWSATRT
ncbi:hypothetical protein [Pseudonocardia kongjuensis]